MVHCNCETFQRAGLIIDPAVDVAQNEEGSITPATGTLGKPCHRSFPYSGVHPN